MLPRTPKPPTLDAAKAYITETFDSIPADVPVLGEDLSKPIYYVGHEWAVTEYGLEERAGRYAIEAKRLWEDANSYPWEKHMAEKGWVNMLDFVFAIDVARRIHIEKKPTK